MANTNKTLDNAHAYLANQMYRAVPGTVEYQSLLDALTILWKRVSN